MLRLFFVGGYRLEEIALLKINLGDKRADGIVR
jgi:hypothetical protein